MSKKEKMIEKVKALFPHYTNDQVIQVANFLCTLSEVYYANSTKSNPTKKAA